MKGQLRNALNKLCHCIDLTVIDDQRKSFDVSAPAFLANLADIIDVRVE